jgi:hypothetical protein
MAYAAEFTVDVTGIAFEGDLDEITDIIESALAAWKPSVTVTVREYQTPHRDGKGTS